MVSENQVRLYDLVAIGTGPAGEKGAATAAAFGKRVAVVEREPVVGGASTNTGTLPSKTLRETALALSGLRSRELYGVDLSLRREATVADFMYHEGKVKEEERERVLANLRFRAVDLLYGTASFADPHTIRVARSDGSPGVLLRGKRILIATGSAPLRPSEFDFASPRIHDSDEILRLERLPRSLAVIGAGVIGSEYACTFAALGCEVIVIDGRDVLLPFLDREISGALTAAMEGLGVTFQWKERVTGCTPTPSGRVSVSCASGLSFEADDVLVAAGRTSNTADLNVAAAGITVGDRGLIKVDQYYRTEIPHIYAAGDVIGFPALASTSAEQARVAVCHAFDIPYKGTLSPLLPIGIYTIPEISMVGETEEQLRARGAEYVVGRAPYAANARGQIIHDRSGFLKLLFDRTTMKLLGAHAIGEQATELIHIGLVAMLIGEGAELFNLACFNYPTLSDLYKHAAYDAILQVSGAEHGPSTTR